MTRLFRAMHEILLTQVNAAFKGMLRIVRLLSCNENQKFWIIRRKNDNEYE